MHGDQNSVLTPVVTRSVMMRLTSYTDHHTDHRNDQVCVHARHLLTCPQYRCQCVGDKGQALMAQLSQCGAARQIPNYTTMIEAGCLGGQLGRAVTR